MKLLKMKKSELLEKVKSFSERNTLLEHRCFLKVKTVNQSIIAVDTSRISSTRSDFDYGDPFLYKGEEKGIFIGLFRQLGISAWVVAFEKDKGKVRMFCKDEPLKPLSELGFEKIED